MLLTSKLLDELSFRAKSIDHLRVNFNLHERSAESVQRLFNAMELGTVIPVHQHLNAAETIVLLRGKLQITYYDNEKKVIKSNILEPFSDSFGVHIPKGTWHGVDVLEPGTVVFEVKEGPYEPLKESEILK